ncbi:threonyl-carbamoyl synthesis 1 [Rhynchophorus ferrugineus]|uniref:threonyl-carbamoyl synthesis 1 n=1 Tax=Rhynchophorus ferrugineus TaxID=354439 RepID=UPI003FCD561C
MAEHISIHRPDAVDCAINFIKSGSVIAVPTETVYGLACDATNSQAIHKLYNVKQRNEHKPVALCLTKIDDICLWAKITHLPNGLLQKLLPGPVTLLLSSINTLEPSLCCNGKIGIRVPDYNFIQKLVSGLGTPLALTSANLSNEPSAIRTVEFKKIWNNIPARVDSVLSEKELLIRTPLIY